MATDGLRRFCRVAVLMLSLVVTASVAPCHAGPPGVPVSEAPSGDGTITPIVGEVLVRRSGTENWLPVGEGEMVSPGDTVRTGPDGRCYITFFEGSESLLDAGTEMTIQKLSVRPEESFEIKLHVWLGNTWHSVQKFYGSDSRYEVETPSATLVARGTIWWVRVDDTQATTTSVLEGAVEKTGDYTAIDPGDVPAEDAMKPLIERLVAELNDPAFADLVASAKDEGIVVESKNGDEKTRKVGLGVIGQAYYLAQHIESLLPDQAAEMSQKIGCDGLCTPEGLLTAKAEKQITWGEVHAILGIKHASVGEMNGEANGRKGQGKDKGPDKRDNSSQDRDKSDSGGGGGKKGGGKKS